MKDRIYLIITGCIAAYAAWAFFYYGGEFAFLLMVIASTLLDYKRKATSLKR